jgi:hypothetical protein
MSDHVLTYVSLSDYKSPSPEGWSVDLFQVGYRKMRKYLRNTKNLLTSDGLHADGLTVGDRIVRMKKDHPDYRFYVDTSNVQDAELLHYFGRFPVKYKIRATRKRAA